MAYTPPDGDAINVVMVDGYTPPSGDSIGVVTNAPEPYTPPAGDAIEVEMVSGYTPPAGNQINVIMGFVEEAVDDGLTTNVSAPSFALAPSLSAFGQLVQTINVNAPTFQAAPSLAGATTFVYAEVFAPAFSGTPTLSATAELAATNEVNAPTLQATPALNGASSMEIAVQAPAMALSGLLSVPGVNLVLEAEAPLFSATPSLIGEASGFAVLAEKFSLSPSLSAATEVSDPWSVYPPALSATPALSAGVGRGISSPKLSTTAELSATTRQGFSAPQLGVTPAINATPDLILPLFEPIMWQPGVVCNGSSTLGLKNSVIEGAGWNGSGQLDCADWLVNSLDMGNSFTVGVKPNGECLATGDDYYNQCSGTSGWTNIKQVACGYYHTIGLKDDGTCIATEYNNNGEGNVTGWSNVAEIAADYRKTVALLNDGTCLATGYASNGQCDVSAWEDIVQVACGKNHTVGLKADGTCVATGDNSFSCCEVSGWTDICYVACGESVTVGVKRNGTCVAIGSNGWGQCDVSEWTNVANVSCGSYHTIGVKRDGSCVGVGRDSDGQCDVVAWAGIYFDPPHSFFTCEKFKALPGLAVTVDIFDPSAVYAQPFVASAGINPVSTGLAVSMPALAAPSGQFGVVPSVGLPVPALSASGTFLVDVEDGSEWARFVKDHGDEAVKLYYCTLTGAADGLDDIQLPMTSFQARLRKEGLSYLQVVTPGIDNLEVISNRPNGTIIIDMAYILQGETRYVEQIASAAFERVDYAEGGLNQSTTLSGHLSTANDAPKQVALKNITYRSVSGGRARARCSVPDLYLKPGDTAILPDISYEVGLITTTVSISPAGCVVSSMEVAA